MFFVLFVLWMIFNGRISWDVVVLGLVLSAGLTLFGQRVCGWSTRYDRLFVRMGGRLLAYAGSLFIEIIKANLAVIRVILSPRGKGVEPRIFFFDSHLKSDAAKTALANSITITPGTFTLGIYGSTFAVHALNRDFEAGTPDSALNRRLLAMEQKAEQEGIL